MARLRKFLAALAVFAAGAWAVPGDGEGAFPDNDSSHLDVSVDRQRGRTQLRHHLVWQVVRPTKTLQIMDTSLFRWADNPGLLGGEAYLMLNGRIHSDSLWGASWALMNRTDGLVARDASLGENAWRQIGMLRRTFGDSSLGGVVAVGALAEHSDPGRLSQGIRAMEPPYRGFSGAGAWSVAGNWSGFEEIPTQVAALWSDLVGVRGLRQARTLLDASLTASLTGTGTDTALLEVRHDSVRTRSDYLLSDRVDLDRSARVAWAFPVGSHRWMVAGSWGQTLFQDNSKRNPALTRSMLDGEARVEGRLWWGWSQKHVLMRQAASRCWTTGSSGDSLGDAMRAEQDRRDQDQTEELTLSDTLVWKSSRWGGVGVDLGAVQSLRSVRYPLNLTPAQADRPDEDLSRRQLSVGLRWEKLAWGGKPLLAWSILEQQDVYLRAVQSIQTWDRVENRLALNLSAPLREWARPNLGLWASEQRDRWRFQAGHGKGTLEYGMVIGAELGPSEKPWVVAKWTRWMSKNGALVGTAFAPDRIQDDWLPELRGFLRSGTWRLEPWANSFLERVTYWGGSGWLAGGRSRATRLGSDIVGEGANGLVSISVGYVWSDPGDDAWMGSMAAKVAW